MFGYCSTDTGRPLFPRELLPPSRFSGSSGLASQLFPRGRFSGWSGVPRYLLPASRLPCRSSLIGRLSQVVASLVGVACPVTFSHQVASLVPVTFLSAIVCHLLSAERYGSAAAVRRPPEPFVRLAP